MNLTLKEVVQTSPEGDKFFRLPEVYIRGNNVRKQQCLVVNDPLTLGRSNTSEYLKRLSTRSRSSNRTNKPQVVAVVVHGVIWVAGAIEDEERAEEREDVVGVEAVNEHGSYLGRK